MRMTKSLLFLFCSLISGPMFAQAYIPEKGNPKVKVKPSAEINAFAFNLRDIRLRGDTKELYFTDAQWPDFGREDIDIALAEYGRRKRKFGGLLPEDIEALRQG